MKVRPQFAARIQFALIISVCSAAVAFSSVLSCSAALQDASVSKSGQPVNYEAAEREYEQQTKTQPHSAKAWSNLGAVRAIHGNCSAALPALARARSLDPGLFVPWYFSGYCHLARHEGRKALEELKRATRLNPKDFNGWYLEAESAADSNQLGLSLAAVSRSLSLDSKRPEGYYLAGQDALGIAKREYNYVVNHQPSPFAMRLRAERNAGQGVWMAALADYQKARKLSPGAPDIAFGLGTVYLEKGDFAEAEKEFRQCLEKVPDSSWVKLRMALALAAQSKKNEADEILKDVEPSDLASPSEWQDLIAAELLLGQTEAAEDSLGRAESLFPDFPEWQDWSERLKSEAGAAPGHFSFEFEQAGTIALPVNFLLSSRLQSGNFVRLIFPDSARFEAFRKAFLSEDATAAAGLMPTIHEEPSDSARAFVNGEILQRLGLIFFERLEIDYPDSQPAMVLEAQKYSAHGDQAKAIEVYKTLLRNNGPSPDILRNLASVYWKQHQWTEALPALEQLAKIDPYDPTTFINLGRIYFFQQNLKEAEKNFRMAMRIQPNMYEAHFGLGQVFQRMGEPKNAIPELKMAERAQPLNPRPHYFLSQVYRMAGDKNLAAEEMASFQRLQAQSGSEGTEQGGGLVPVD